MARSERFELPTSWFVAMHSIQLSYERTPLRLGIYILGNIAEAQPLPFTFFTSRRPPPADRTRAT